MSVGFIFMSIVSKSTMTSKKRDRYISLARSMRSLWKFPKSWMFECCFYLFWNLPWCTGSWWPNTAQSQKFRIPRLGEAISVLERRWIRRCWSQMSHPHPSHLEKTSVQNVNISKSLLSSKSDSIRKTFAVGDHGFLHLKTSDTDAWIDLNREVAEQETINKAKRIRYRMTVCWNTVSWYLLYSFTMFLSFLPSHFYFTNRQGQTLWIEQSMCIREEGACLVTTEDVLKEKYIK